jgi:hypothetical protein
MKITLDIEHLEEYGCFTGGVGKTNKDDNNLDIKIDWSQLYINGIEAITEKQISNIGYFLTDSKPRGDDYPDRLIVSLGDDRKLKYGESNEYALEFADPSYYTFEEIFRMILTEQGTRGMDEKYALRFKEHLIDIYDKTVEKEKQRNEL